MFFLGPSSIGVGVLMINARHIHRPLTSHMYNAGTDWQIRRLSVQALFQENDTSCYHSHPPYVAAPDRICHGFIGLFKQPMLHILQARLRLKYCEGLQYPRTCMNPAAQHTKEKAVYVRCP